MNPNTLLTAALLMGCMACGSADGPTAVTPSDPPPATFPSFLVGKWRITAASGQQCDDLGHCTPAYGGSESYTFAADGSFEYAQYLASNLNGCQLVTFLHVLGAAAVEDQTITLTSTSAHNKKQDGCGETTDQDLQLDPASYTWRLTWTGTAEQLELTSSAGTSGPLDRVP
jgi:hypothetical protein